MFDFLKKKPAVETVGAEAEKPQQPKALASLICPHCRRGIGRVEFRDFGNGMAILVGCGYCHKVIGGTAFAALKKQ